MQNQNVDLKCPNTSIGCSATFVTDRESKLLFTDWLCRWVSKTFKQRACYYSRTEGSIVGGIDGFNGDRCDQHRHVSLYDDVILMGQDSEKIGADDIRGRYDFLRDHVEFQTLRHEGS
jgi:hypothetical protein